MLTHDELGLDEASTYERSAAEFSRVASACRKDGDDQGLANALLGLGWAREKLGDGAEGLRLASEARSLLCDIGDLSQVAECCHTMAVWSFHHLDGADSVVDFTEAATVRESIGDQLLAAESWHNMAYVQLMHGQAEQAEEGYTRSADLLREVESGLDPDRAASAVRQHGFVLSHVALARARHGTCADAIDATTSYFRHIDQTGHPREPVLAYLAVGTALDEGRGRPGPSGPELERRSGQPLEAETWLRWAVDQASKALVVPTGSRRAYLGSHLLALAELAAWCARQGNKDEAARLSDDAVDRAAARGWLGEVGRLERRRRHWEERRG